MKTGKDMSKKNQTGGVVKLVAAWRKIASGFGAMVATGWAWATGSDMVATVDYHSSGGDENLRGVNPVGGVKTMAMPQSDDTIEAIKRLDACGRLRALLQRPATQARLCLGRWRLKSAAVWYDFIMSGKE